MVGADDALSQKDDQCCLYKSRIVHEREKGMRPNWPPIYTILMVAFMAPQPLETCAFHSESCRLYKVQCTMYTLQNEALWLRLLPTSMSQSWHAYLQHSVLCIWYGDIFEGSPLESITSCVLGGAGVQSAGISGVGIQECYPLAL